MHNIKIYVYAICKNEEKFVDRWYESMKEADGIYVLDTGSTDNTYKKLKEKKVKIKKSKIKPWRFDVARNRSLDMVPIDADICVCTDLDEVFEKGWRKKLENSWNNHSRAKYIYNWYIDKTPKITFYLDKIHTRFNYTWTHPVHEVLTYTGCKENVLICDNITLNHYPDRNKSRSSYLKLLELSVKEDPYNDRNMHYLGREYMYYKMYDKAIEYLKKHLKISNWSYEKSASYRYIGRCYKMKNDYKNAFIYYLKSIKEAPNLKEPYIETAFIYYEIEDYEKVIELLNKSLGINTTMYYLNELFSNDGTVYDLLSIAYFYTKQYEKSLININKALEYKEDKRLLENKNIIQSIKKAI